MRNHPNDSQFQILLNVKGRLNSIEEFKQVIIKVGDQGQLTRLSDVARVDLGQDSYSLRAELDNQPALAMPIFQRPGSNAIELSDQVRETMARLSKDFPEGVEYDIVYDPTVFVRGSIDAVIATLLEAIALVVIVVIVFFTNVARVNYSAYSCASFTYWYFCCNAVAWCFY